MSQDPLAQLIGEALALPAPPEVQALVAALRQRCGDRIGAILFYGACRRTPDVEGLVDLYVLHDGHRRFHQRWLPALLNRLLPPTVILVTAQHGEHVVRAKVAILSRNQFARRLRPESMDTTVWARFCQPASLLHASDPATEPWLRDVLARGLRTAADWAVHLGPTDGTSEQCWQSLFAHTYGAELRPERSDRPSLVYQSNAAWFDRILAVRRCEAGAIAPTHRSWMARRAWGKVLNVARLVKAAFTFENGADYVAWKIERHTGRPLILTDWQRRHPVLTAPWVLWRYRKG